MAIRKKHIRSLVESILQERRVKKAPIPVETVVESMGIQLRTDEVEDRLSGFLVRSTDTGNAVIGVNASHAEGRRRFTIAHELGHYLLHEGEAVHFDGERPGFTVNLRNTEDFSAAATDMEREANLFAAELLMPARFLERDSRIKRIDLLDDEESQNVLNAVADEYKVSVQALTYRLANLGLIDPL